MSTDFEDWQKERYRRTEGREAKIVEIEIERGAGD
jgi:hypothetical protein